MAYWNGSNRTNRNAFVVVRVKDGDAVIEDLFIGDKRIRDLVKDMK